MKTPSCSPLYVDDVRRRAAQMDPDMYLASLFARPDRMWAVWTMMAFYADTVLIMDRVSDARLGLIRLQWLWDQVDAALPGHHEPAVKEQGDKLAFPVLCLLVEGVQAGYIDRNDVTALLTMAEDLLRKALINTKIDGDREESRLLLWNILGRVAGGESAFSRARGVIGGMRARYLGIVPFMALRVWFTVRFGLYKGHASRV
jgi:hypothetical protein